MRSVSSVGPAHPLCALVRQLVTNDWQSFTSIMNQARARWERPAAVELESIEKLNAAIDAVTPNGARMEEARAMARQLMARHSRRVLREYVKVTSIGAQRWAQEITNALIAVQHQGIIETDGSGRWRRVQG